MITGQTGAVHTTTNKTPGLRLHVKIMTRQNCPMPKHRTANDYAGLRHLMGISQLHAPAAFPLERRLHKTTAAPILAMKEKNTISPQESNLGSSEYS